jgi:hypothetical protein
MRGNTMNQRSKYLAGSAIALTLLAAAAAVQNDVSAPDEAGVVAGVSAGMHFTDAEGNLRRPSAEERAELAAAFQKDLVRITRGKNIPRGSKQEPSGAVSAVVGAEKLKFLVVNVDENGQAVFGHASIDENGRVETKPANKLPEM